MKYLYSEKNNFIYKLNTSTVVFFIFTLFLLSLIFTHPIYLGTLFIITTLMIITSGNWLEWKGYLRLSIPIVIMIILVNSIFVKTGSNVIYQGPTLPFIGRLRITLEALAYGGAMGLRLIIIISLFCLYTYTVQPDKFMKLFSRFSSKIIFIVILSIRLFPLLIEDYKRIIEVQKTRGVKINKGKWIDKIKNALPIISVLLLSSLERSFEQAESMYARGYGSGKRSIYQKDIKRRRDYIITISTIIGLASGLCIFTAGQGSYSYYPKLSNPSLLDYRLYSILVITMILPAILNWGWKKWPILKSKI